MKVEHRQIVERVWPARRVLVIDDHASFRRRARALLGPELGLLDIRPPHSDGLAVANGFLAKADLSGGGPERLLE